MQGDCSFTSPIIIVICMRLPCCPTLPLHDKHYLPIYLPTLPTYLKSSRKEILLTTTFESFFLSDQPSPSLSISLSSNNPFRNRAGSPLPKSPASPFDDPAPQSASSIARPQSTNPFLDSTQTQKPASPTTAEPLITMADEKETKPSLIGDDVFVCFWN